MKFLAKIKGFRTLIAQGISALIGVLAMLGVIPVAEIAGITPETVGADFDKVSGSVDVVVGAVMTVTSVINSYLRLITKGPVGSK